MRISIVTLNFNGSEDTIKLLKSLEEQTDKDFQIIVVDNASEEADFTNLQSTITASNIANLKLLRNSENFGFSGGSNVGTIQALKNGSDWVVFLNNDTWVERDFVERLIGVLAGKKGVVGIPLIEGDRVAYCGGVRWLKPHGHHIYDTEDARWENNKYAIGGAMAVHKNVFDKTGFLDEKYFLYFEDADFSIRVRKAGFDISIGENLNVHHHVSSSTKKLGSPLLLRYHYRNALYFNLKNGPWYIKLAVWPWSWFIIIKQLVKLVLKINTVQSKAISNGVVDFYLHRFGKIK